MCKVWGFVDILDRLIALSLYNNQRSPEKYYLPIDCASFPVYWSFIWVSYKHQNSWMFDSVQLLCWHFAHLNADALFWNTLLIIFRSKGWNRCGEKRPVNRNAANTCESAHSHLSTSVSAGTFLWIWAETFAPRHKHTVGGGWGGGGSVRTNMDWGSSINLARLPSHHWKLLPLAWGGGAHTRELLAGGFGGTGQSFFCSTTPLCFIVGYSWGATRVSALVFPMKPPPDFPSVSTVTGRRCQRLWVWQCR